MKFSFAYCRNVPLRPHKAKRLRERPGIRHNHYKRLFEFFYNDIDVYIKRYIQASLQ